MKDIAPILRSLGLLDSEIKTYRAALEKGPQTVIDLSKLTKLSRQATYVAMEALTERGLMSSVLRGKKRFYAAEHPSKLLAYAKRHQADVADHVNDLERTLPELELQIGGERPVVKVYEGKEGIRAALEELTKAGAYSAPLDEITDLDAMFSVLQPEDLKPYRDQTSKKDVQIRSLLAGEPRSPLSKVDRIVLPKELTGFKTNITLFERYIYLVTFEGKMFSVLIESPALAKTMRILYDMAFKEAKRTFSKKPQ